MVSVGYMDPGNWATDLAAGARFGYRLIWVILLSNLMAILLQTLAARLGIVSGRDLAQACRDHYRPAINLPLWVLCELAIAACDLAEVLGSAIGLSLLFGIPMIWGVCITALDVMLLLLLQTYGIRKLEAVVLTLVATIGACFALQLVLSRPQLPEVARGLVPGSLNAGSLYIAIGIIGATVMPHNLYLHSALVQSRGIQRTPAGLAQATRFNLIDSVVALNAAFFVNAAILCLAAATFHSSGHAGVASLHEAHSLLRPLLGSGLAPVAFALALLAAGQSSTITGTLAGQVVMEGFVRVRLRPWLRRLVTRALAIIPAVAVILWKGDSGVDALLILSQVVLSLQLPFAIVPLIHFTSDRGRMGSLVTPGWGRALAWLAAALIIALNLKLVSDTIVEGLRAGSLVVRYLLLPAALLLVPLLGWMIVQPWVAPRIRQRAAGEAPDISDLFPEATLQLQYRRIAIALEVSHHDRDILRGIIPLARTAGAAVILIHVVESAAARFLGADAADEEAREDAEYLQRLSEQLQVSGLQCAVRIGSGEAEHEIARIAGEERADLIVTGSHGHRLLGDLFHGSTASELRHLTTIPVLTIRSGLPAAE